jgi:hypothetical protein
MRKRLIAKDRETEELRREWFVLLANTAGATLEKLRILATNAADSLNSTFLIRFS